MRIIMDGRTLAAVGGSVRAWAVSVAILALAGARPDDRVWAQDERFVPLFDGRTLEGWVVENTDAGNFSVRNGVLRVEGPGGWLRSSDEFGDFLLRIELRFLTDDADSGIFVRVPPPARQVFARGWPSNAYQIQARDISRNRTEQPLWIANVYRHGLPAGETHYDSAAALRAFKATGDWQVLLIEARGSQLDVTLNGVPTTRASGIVTPRGHIGIQGETGILELRSIEIATR